MILTRARVRAETCDGKDGMAQVIHSNPRSRASGDLRCGVGNAETNCILTRARVRAETYLPQHMHDPKRKF